MDTPCNFTDIHRGHLYHAGVIAFPIPTHCISNPNTARCLKHITLVAHVHNSNHTRSINATSLHFAVSACPSQAASWSASESLAFHWLPLEPKWRRPGPISSQTLTPPKFHIKTGKKHKIAIFERRCRYIINIHVPKQFLFNDPAGHVTQPHVPHRPALLRGYSTWDQIPRDWAAVKTTSLDSASWRINTTQMQRVAVVGGSGSVSMSRSGSQVVVVVVVIVVVVIVVVDDVTMMSHD